MFDSFFIAGFECATGINRHGQWIDQIEATQHDRFVDEDYAMLREVGIAAAREGVRWPLVDRGARHDFSSLLPFLDAARRHGVELIFDLFHFGYPPDLDPLSRQFADRFADYCYAATGFIAARSERPPVLTPINEPSYFAWAAGDAGLFAPHWSGRGWDLKVALIGAAIRGIEAIWAACPEARIVNVDPLCRTVTPLDRPDLAAESEWMNDTVVFQSWDMLCGRLVPELGGSRRHLGVVGVNYYWKNQWEIGRPDQELDESDSRRWALRRLIRSVWERYGGELLITETSHIGERRSDWLRYVADEAEALLYEGVPLRGVCVYPILGMPEWHNREQWTRMGLWDLIPQSPCLGRVLCEPMMDALREAQRIDGRVTRKRG